MPVETIRWDEGRLFIVDQTQLPTVHTMIPLDTVQAVWDAIESLQVRGAPAIGVCAALGVVVAVREAAPRDAQGAREEAARAADFLATSRPTAVNLFWALDRMRACAGASAELTTAEAVLAALEAEALAIFEEDRRLCDAIGQHGAGLIEEGHGVLTHCNAGALATSGSGTALSVMYAAAAQGRSFQVFADETRPLLQGARLTAWELHEAGIDVTVICDNMAAHVMKQGRVDLVITGADRIAANGDAANKIGTYGLALIARAHGIPFYVAAPSSTFDLTLASGESIPIEERRPEEVTHGFGRPTAPEGVGVYNPAFDVTPAELISGIVTEHGMLAAPYGPSISRHIGTDATSMH